MTKSLQPKLLALLGMLLVPMMLMAQDATGRITGVVTDSSGALVPNAKVIARNTATNLSKETAADQNGFYQILLLPIGKYRVQAEAAGFSRMVVAENTIEINQTLRVDIQLQVGHISDTVTVEAAGNLVETQSATVGATVTGSAIFELPLNGRNALDLLATQPGITEGNPDSRAVGNYSIAGGRTDSVTYLLDGGLNNSLIDNGIVANPNPDAIAEFRVLENNYGAEYGRSAGGVVSIVTKSGTNQFHGTAYDYLRNDALNANTYFNNQQGLARAVLKRNQFGGTIGGPIKRDKLFFFFAYQGQRQTALDAGLGKVTTFTPLEARGDFSQSPALDRQRVASFLSGNPYFQPNPMLAAQGVIDPSRIDPVAQAYFKQNLIATSPTGFLFPQATAKANSGEYLGKFDYNLTSRDMVSGTFTSRDFTMYDPFSGYGAFMTGYPSTNSETTYFGTLTYTHTFAPTLLNEFRVTAQRYNEKDYYPAEKRPTAADLGVGTTPDNPTGPPRLAFFGHNFYTGFSSQGPANKIDNTYAVYDNLTWTKGRHTWKYGFYFSPYQNNTKYDYYVNGEFYFYGPSTFVGSGSDFADFLLGLPDEYIQYGSAPSNIRSKSYAGYAQDEWHASNRLTLTLGIRYEYSQPKLDTQGRSYSIVPGLQSQRFPNAPAGLVFPGDPGAPQGANFPDRNDWAPRAGFAWDVFGNAKTSIRGGFGVFYDILKGEDNLQFNGQAPFFGFEDIYFNPPGDSAPINFSNPFLATGTVNTFPSKPPAHDIDFRNSGFLPFGGASVYFVDPHLRTPYVYQYNFSVQQQLAPGLVVESGYLGYSSHKLTAIVDVNPFILGTNTRILNSGFAASNPQFSYLNEFQNVSKANYNALEVNLRKQMSNMGGWGSSFFTLGYTWSHQIDNVSGYREHSYKVPYYNHDQFRASGDTDIRQVVTLSGGWDLPFDNLWKGGPKLLTSGWSLYPILTYRTGFPLDVYANLNTTRWDPGPSGAGDASLVRADLVGNSVPTFDPHQYQAFNGSAGNYYFDPANFSAARASGLDAQSQSDASQLSEFTYGTFPRNGFRGPGRFNMDFSLTKTFRLKERLSIELRGDAFNLLNNVQFGNPNMVITSSTFGQISTLANTGGVTNPEGPRIVQLALHLKF